MYNTYKNVFKVKPEFSSLGTGVGKVRLPRGATITLDMVAVFVLTFPFSWFIGSFVFGLILGSPTVLNKIIYSVIISGAITVYSKKLDPSGKMIIRYLYDILTFTFRGKLSDGWMVKEKNDTKLDEFNIETRLISENQVGSLPAVGKSVKEFELKVPLNIKIRGNRIYFSRNGKKLPPGTYGIEKGKLFPKVQKKVVSTQIKVPISGPIKKSDPPSLKRM